MKPMIEGARFVIEVTVNGEPVRLNAPVPIAELLTTAGVPPDYLAVEVNEMVVPRETHGEHLIHEGDAVEVVTLVGGG